jgi:predicted acylesterase/phospholipase RssA
LDVAAEADVPPPPDVAALDRIAPHLPPLPATDRPRSVLVLSGGGSYGAYSAGVLVGWSQTGCRPEFDVVTGISTGALIAPLAFLGPEHDDTLRWMYTTLRSRDLFRFNRTLRSLLLSDALADPTPLAEKIEKMATPEILRRIAWEHARGRRLYVGTTELESRRAVVWDLGAIATRGTTADLDLFRKVLLASASIPGFFPPVRIPVTVDGRELEERHVDGGVTQALFYHPPPGGALAGTNVHVIVAGKLYSDPDVVRPRALVIAADSVSTILFAQTRAELFRIHTACVLGGLNFQLAAIPPEYPALFASTDFDPEAMALLFEEGVRQAAAGTAFRSNPPDTGPGEGAFHRTSTQLTHVPLGLPGPSVRPRTAILPWRTDRGVPAQR